MGKEWEFSSSMVGRVTLRIGAWLALILHVTIE
jgi:hypothetical protein